MMTEALDQSSSSIMSPCGATKPINSSAAALIQVAAYRIDLEPAIVDRVLLRLEEECIKEEWQLKFVDSCNWKQMGTPIGLQASIRSCLQEKDKSCCGGSCSCTSCTEDLTTVPGIPTNETPKVVVTKLNDVALPPLARHLRPLPSGLQRQTSAPGRCQLTKSPGSNATRSPGTRSATKKRGKRKDFLRQDSQFSLPSIPNRRGTVLILDDTDVFENNNKNNEEETSLYEETKLNDLQEFSSDFEDLSDLEDLTKEEFPCLSREEVGFFKDF